MIFLGSLNFHYAGGIVYLVLGSDTAIWSGMSTNRYNNFYDVGLYTNPSRNAYAVMDPLFRSQFLDSYGNPLKMTWWMMAGNIFRYASNTNVPFPNIMTLYLMKKYHGENLILNGDELTLHYHTFFWSDYDGDGEYFWNQSKTFNESKEDFKFTLAQFLLEEEVFPVSFRSGWHYMDNDWQHYLDQFVLPYSLHNDYPHKRLLDEEPIDNIFDWSKAPPTWIPYNPSYANYQIPGDGKSWNVRSASFQRTIAINLIDSIFAAAQDGTDQVACIWAHLPESDFLYNIEKIDSLVQSANSKYEDVTFKYCTAVEAMQLWQESEDQSPPIITLTENEESDEISFNIQTDENIFQSRPFIAVKNIYNDFRVADAIKVGTNNWRTSESFVKSEIVKVGVTVTDDLGNQAMEFIEYLPNDVYIDNSDQYFSELKGNWILSSKNSWGTDSKVAKLSINETVSASWKYPIPKTSHYNIFNQIPEIENHAEIFQFIVSVNGENHDTVYIKKGLEPYHWSYLATQSLDEGDNIEITLFANGDDQTGKYLCADVIKLSALVKDREIKILNNKINLNNVVINQTIDYNLSVSNLGLNELKIFSVHSLNGSLISDFSYPISIPKMSAVDLSLVFLFDELGPHADSLIILSDDPKNSQIMIPVFSDVANYFLLVDNEDSINYSEFGEWQTSVATSNGTSSRYAWLNSSPLSSASFETNLKEGGLYDIQFIVPKTVNASNKAFYELSIENLIVDSLLINQNEGSGNWISIGKYFLPSDNRIKVRVIDSGESTEGQVLRADAIKFQLIEKLLNAESGNSELTIKEYALEQNYPNPFNPTTTIQFQIPKSEHVKIILYNLLGEKIRTLVDVSLNAGYHSTTWDGLKEDGSNVSTGPYFYRITAGSFNESKKMIYLR